MRIHWPYHGTRLKIPACDAFVPLKEGKGIYHSSRPVGRLMRLIARCWQTRETGSCAFPSCLALHTVEEFAFRCQRPADRKAKSNFRASKVLRGVKTRVGERGNSCRCTEYPLSPFEKGERFNGQTAEMSSQNYAGNFLTSRYMSGKKLFNYVITTFHIYISPQSCNIKICLMP